MSQEMIEELRKSQQEFERETQSFEKPDGMGLGNPAIHIEKRGSSHTYC